MTRLAACVLPRVATLASGCASRAPVDRATAIRSRTSRSSGSTTSTARSSRRPDANGRIGTVAAGGVEYFAAHIARLKAENPNTIVVSAGDNIGASPLLSGMFHDEPTIEALGAAGLQISAVGNHEFDEGWEELTRMQKGGCHPVTGCQDRTPFAGASFQYLAANVMRGGQTLFPATAVKWSTASRSGSSAWRWTGTPSIVQSHPSAGADVRLRSRGRQRGRRERWWRRASRRSWS